MKGLAPMDPSKDKLFMLDDFTWVHPNYGKSLKERMLAYKLLCPLSLRHKIYTKTSYSFPFCLRDVEGGTYGESSSVLMKVCKKLFSRMIHLPIDT